MGPLISMSLPINATFQLALTNNSKKLIMFFCDVNQRLLVVSSLLIENMSSQERKLLSLNTLIGFLVPRIGVDRYVFFRADADTDYYRSSRPITDILNRYTCLV